jgi:hypothetical protein
VLGKAERGVATYDEGPLVAQPWAEESINVEDEITTYPLGENAYLDTDFLQAIGELNDRGLAAECLCLTQIEGEFHYLKQWERRLNKWEQAIHLKQGDLIQRKWTTNSC